MLVGNPRLDSTSSLTGREKGMGTSNVNATGFLRERFNIFTCTKKFICRNQDPQVPDFCLERLETYVKILSTHLFGIYGGGSGGSVGGAKALEITSYLSSNASYQITAPPSFTSGRCMILIPVQAPLRGSLKLSLICTPFVALP